VHRARWCHYAHRLAFRTPGDAVVLRQLFRGRIWNAAAATVVRDDADKTVVWLPPASSYAMGERADEIRTKAARILAAPPWPTGWEDWQPQPGWQLPLLPPGWDVREG
jgi:hypothetical protein